MKEYLPILAIITIVAVGGLAVLVVDSGTGLAITPMTQATKQVKPPFCVQLANEIKPIMDDFISHNCALYLPIEVRLLCPKPVKSGYSWGTPPPECGMLGFALDQKVNQLIEKAKYDESCNAALKNLRAKYGITCPRLVAN